jgi:hypothetical protein
MRSKYLSKLLLVSLMWMGVSLVQGDCDSSIVGITNEYVTAFWPLWLSVNQINLEPSNTLIGPDKITPVYQVRWYSLVTHSRVQHHA